MMKNHALKKIGLALVLFSGILFVSAAFADNPRVLMMATTTSTDNTGLLDILKPAFQKQTGIELKWTPTGTGKALKLGENCDVDVLMVHAPTEEKKYMENGFGLGRRQVMYNDFVIIGPKSDPAGIQGKSVADALRAIFANKQAFISRGDNSGTHVKELSLWQAANLEIPEKQSWYIQCGQGMLAVINIAEERKGYTLIDRGTYIRYEANMGGSPPLKILVEDNTTLFNQYSVIAVNPAHCPDVAYEAAVKFINWITGPEAQKMIKDFRLLGKVLFTPNAKRL